MQGQKTTTEILFPAGKWICTACGKPSQRPKSTSYGAGGIQHFCQCGGRLTTDKKVRV